MKYYSEYQLYIKNQQRYVKTDAGFCMGGDCCNDNAVQQAADRRLLYDTIAENTGVRYSSSCGTLNYNNFLYTGNNNHCGCHYSRDDDIIFLNRTYGRYGRNCGNSASFGSGRYDYRYICDNRYNDRYSTNIYNFRNQSFLRNSLGKSNIGSYRGRY